MTLWKIPQQNWPKKAFLRHCICALDSFSSILQELNPWRLSHSVPEKKKATCQCLFKMGHRSTSSVQSSATYITHSFISKPIRDDDDVYNFWKIEFRGLFWGIADRQHSGLHHIAYGIERFRNSVTRHEIWHQNSTLGQNSLCCSYFKT